MKLEMPVYVMDLIHTLNESGYECYVVGGAVRSMLLDLPVHDFDLTTNALPEQMKEVFQDYRTFDTGIKHGTLTVLSASHPIEITTYRKDSPYKDHRHPDSVCFTSAIEEDCARRDFTINALCYHPDQGILDFFHGKEDMKAKLIRAIGNPYQRFDEDALRILRAIRFAARLNFKIEENTKEALLAKREDLSFISIERIHEETEQFFNAKSAPVLFKEYIQVFEVFLPELKELDCIEELYICLNKSTADHEVRMTVILSFFIDPASVLRRMKYANDPKRRILNMIALREYPHDSKKDVLHLLHDLKAPLNEYASYLEALSIPTENLISIYKEIEINHDCYQLKDMKIHGDELIAIGYQNQEISLMLNECLEMIMDGKILNDHEALLTYAKERFS